MVQHDTDLWSSEHLFGWQGGRIRSFVRMTVIRLRSGALDALGPVAFIVVPRAHGKFADEASRIFPSTQLLAAPSAPSRRSLAFDATLADQPLDDRAGEIESLLVQGFPLQEVLLLHRPSRTRVITDLCFNIRCSASRVARLFFRANGMWQRFGPSRIIRRIGVTDRAAFRRSLEPGKLADPVSVDRNPLTVDPAAIKDIRVVEMIEEGETIYTAKLPQAM